MCVNTINHQAEQAETDLSGASINTCYGQTIVLAHSPYKQNVYFLRGFIEWPFKERSNALI